MEKELLEGLKWKKYLDSAAILHDHQDFKNWDGNMDFEQRHVLEKDLGRTRQELVGRRVVQLVQLAKIVTFYCKRHNINYQQSMLEVAIPFHMFFRLGWKTSKCYAYFNQFMHKYFTNILVQRVFLLSSLQKDSANQGVLPYTKFCLHLCQVLLRYHLPALELALTRMEVDLGSFVTPWIMTLFQRQNSQTITPIHLVLLFYDQFIQESSQEFLFFLVAAAIQSLRESIESLVEGDPFDNTDLLQYMNRQTILFHDAPSMMRLIEQARHLRSNTPASFETYLQNQYFSQKQILTNKEVSTLLDQKHYQYIQVYNPEFLRQLSSPASPRLLLVDCRIKKPFKIEDPELCLNVKGSWLKHFAQEKQKIVDLLMGVEREVHLVFGHSVARAEQERECIHRLLAALALRDRAYCSVLHSSLDSLFADIRAHPGLKVALVPKKNKVVKTLKGLFRRVLRL